MASRKEELQEAGRRKLEEFRKKRAAKAGSIRQAHVADANSNETQPLETELVRRTDSDGAVSSNEAGGAITETSGVGVNDDKNSGHGSSNNSYVSPPLANENNAFSANSQTHINDGEYKRYGTLGFAGPSNFSDDKQKKERNDNFGISSGAQGRFPFEIMPDQSTALHSPLVQEIGDSFSQSSYSGLGEAQLENSSVLKDFTVSNADCTDVVSTNISLENPGTALSQNKSDYAVKLPNGHISSLYEDIRYKAKVKESASEVGHNMHESMQLEDHVISDTGGSKRSIFVGHLHNARSGPSLMSESFSTNFSFDVRNSSNHEPVYPATAETKTRRSRPSFLDSVDISRTSLAAPFSPTEPKNDGLVKSNTSEVYSMGVLGSSASQEPLSETKMKKPFSELGIPSMPSAFEHSINSSFSSSSGADLLRQSADENSFERNHRYHSSKPDDDFSALEQHIEDLTQEKFSLQRAVEASRALAESLAAENSSLTESYNQQGSIVNQLKYDMERLQEEINTYLAELESVKLEYGNVLLECNAADERGKLLASEVIGLEEKALRLRSNELKLERQLENSHAEVASYKKKMSSLEKDRQDLLSTIDALQEEKKLLQTKLRKASVSGKSDDSKIPAKKKDISTSTEDLDPRPDISYLEMHNSASVLHNVASSSTLLPENSELNIEVSSVDIPLDQMRIIQNVNILISELALEKEELIKALAAESSHSSRLKDLNKELSRKLETQTQRLELLTAQSMANGNISTKQSDTHTSHDGSAYVDEGVPTYADEGDEVVERVLGWIMKLFPGGPSKRRTSKLL